LDDVVKKFTGGATVHKDLFVEELSDDASHGPHVYGGGVVGLIVKIELWSSILASGHILGEVVILVDFIGQDI
jgi:hypothetical protein